MNYTLFKEKIEFFEFSQNYIVEGSETFLDSVSILYRYSRCVICDKIRALIFNNILFI